MFRTTENNLPQLDNAPQENENANPDHSESHWEDLISQFSQSKLPLDSIPENSDSFVMTERQSRVYSRRKFKDFPVNPQILEFMNETVILVDYSFKNLLNNVKSVWHRCQSKSIARLLNTRIGSNPVTGAENWFNDIESISLKCDYACASKVAKIYELVTSNPLFKRSPKAPSEREIPTIAKITKEILNYDQNWNEGSCHTDEFTFAGEVYQAEFYQANIPFVEVIEL
jgi:hypothetical protein